MRVLVNNNFFRHECPHCKSELGIHLEDISYTEMAHHGAPYSAKCGACGRIVYIPESIIPRNWISTIVGDDPIGS